MAVLGFHFSDVYRTCLLKRTKTATIMCGENYFRVAQEILVYLSNKPNLFKGKIEERIGRAIIERVEIKKVRDLTVEEARLSGSKNLKKLKSELKKWYNSDENSVVTFVKFNLQLEQ